MYIKSLLACLVICSVVAACATHQQATGANKSSANVYGFERSVKDIVFTPQDWPQALHADLYLPEKSGLRPVVVTIHGGGWANRSRGDMVDISDKLVARGYAVFNVSYRFAPAHTFPAQLHDIQHALSWLFSNAAQYRLDIDRINTWGYSSGAHLAALVAAISEIEPINKLILLHCRLFERWLQAAFPPI